MVDKKKKTLKILKKNKLATKGSSAKKYELVISRSM